MTKEFDIEQYVTPLKEASLDTHECERMRSVIRAFARTNPPSVRWATRIGMAPVWAAALVVCVAGSTVALARDAQPDSMLYPLRVAVNDRIAVALSGDDDARDATELRQIVQALDDELAVAMHWEEDFFAEPSTGDEELDSGATVSPAPTPDVEVLHESNELELELRALDRLFEEENDSGDAILSE